MSLSVQQIKSHFPIFQHRPELVYLDNAATTQKPEEVIRAMSHFYEHGLATAHRGLYAEAVAATQDYEKVRAKVAHFIGSDDPLSVAFTSGTTESINIVAHGFLKDRLRQGDEVMVTVAEHHANFIPWQQLCLATGAQLVVIPVLANGDLDLTFFRTKINSSTKLLAITHVSNVLGNVYPVGELIETAHAHGVPVLVDAAQSAGFLPIDVKRWEVDFLAFSAHKMFGPTGVGGLYVSDQWSQRIEPLRYGGGHVEEVGAVQSTFMPYPRKLEAGTANVAAVLGWGAAIDFLSQLDRQQAIRDCHLLAAEFRERCEKLGGVRCLGVSGESSSIVSFVVDKIHPHDVASFLSSARVAVRAGHHCAQPLMDALGLPGTTRASFSIYNTKDDVDKIITVLGDLKKFWS